MTSMELGSMPTISTICFVLRVTTSAVDTGLNLNGTGLEGWKQHAGMSMGLFSNRWTRDGTESAWTVGIRAHVTRRHGLEPDVGFLHHESRPR